MGYTPTAEQTEILDAFRTGDNLTVSAFAGTGKTSTLVLAAASAPNRRGVFTAFNKKIIDDSRGKFGQNVRAQTTHSLATAVAHADGGWRWGRMKAPRLAGRHLATHLSINDPIRLGDGRMFHPSRLASLALMMTDRFAITSDEDLGWWHLPALAGLERPEDRKLVGAALLPAAKRAWSDITSKGGRLRYTHNTYRKEWALTHPRIEGDFLMIDEAQDSASVLIGVVKDQTDMQVITVGDPFQAINGWAGAVDSMNDFDGQQLHLTKSFRFGPAIAEEANKWLALLSSPLRITGNENVPSRIAGTIAPDAILCRTNGAAVAAVMDFQAEGRRVGLLGDASEIIRLADGARDLKEKGWTSHPDLTAFPSWGSVQDYVINDDAGADLKVMVDLIDTHGVDAIEQAMNGLADSRYAEVTLSTAHKCKGAEWDNVRIGSDFRRPKANEDGAIIPSRDAAMLAYVAVTRAKVGLDRGSLAWVDEALQDAAGTGAPKAGHPTAVARPVTLDPAQTFRIAGTLNRLLDDGMGAPLCHVAHPKYRAMLCSLTAGHDGDHTDESKNYAGGPIRWATPALATTR